MKNLFGLPRYNILQILCEHLRDFHPCRYHGCESFTGSCAENFDEIFLNFLKEYSNIRKFEFLSTKRVLLLHVM